MVIIRPTSFGPCWAISAAEHGQVDVAARIRRHLDHLQPRHAGRRRVGAVRRVGDEDHVAAGLAPVVQVFAHDQHAGQLAVRAGRGLERHRGEAGDLGQQLLQVVDQRHRALAALRGLERVQRGEAGDPRRDLVDLRVILHCTRPSG